MDDKTKPNDKRTIRWWPAGLILAAALIAYTILRIVPHDSHQSFNFHVAQLIAITFVLLLYWVVRPSRMPGRVRLAILGMALGSFVVVAALFRFHGVNGNLIPILEPRWVHQEFAVPQAAAIKVTHSPPVGAADFPQFLGPSRDGRLSGPKLGTNWTEQPPAQLWRVPVGPAWSGFAVAGGVAITQEQRGEEECVVAYELQSGKVIWSHADKRHYLNTLAGEGPRATPTIIGGRVLTEGATGLLNCLNLADGSAVWSRDILKENGARVPPWGEAISPLVENDLVIVSGGGPTGASLAAYRATDGSLAWSSGVLVEAGYSSPILAMLGGTKQILLFADTVTGSDAMTGKQLWHFPWPGGHPHVSVPVIVGDSDVIISSGYGTGSARVKVERDAAGHWSVKQVWRTNRMKAKFTDLILQGGCLYGLDDGIMECIDAGTGALAWKDGRYGHGQTLLVGELLLVMAEDGEVILLDPQPDRLRELTRFTVLKDKTWNPPALAGEYLLVRNDKEGACFRMPVRK